MGSPEPLRLAVVGVGSIGALHARKVAAGSSTRLAAICDTDARAEGLARSLEVPHVSNYEVVPSVGVDGVVIATPNHLHAPIANFFLEAGIPVLVEKPIADSVAAGHELCETARRVGVPLLVGHHRRHNPLVRAAREMITSEIGSLLGVSTMVTMRKPDSYYEESWRRSSSAGPLLVNLIHEVDMIRFMCGEIDAVQAGARRLNRSWDFEDTAGVLLHLRNGALVTVFLTESSPSPWSWEASVSEGMGFYDAGQDYARYLGTEASLSLPSLTLWSYEAGLREPGWNQPLSPRMVAVTAADPYLAQIENFADVILGRAEPVVTGYDGLRSLAVVEAIVAAAHTGTQVDVDTFLENAC
jgi:predicted dehydrogenase